MDSTSLLDAENKRCILKSEMTGCPNRESSENWIMFQKPNRNQWVFEFHLEILEL